MSLFDFIFHLYHSLWSIISEHRIYTIKPHQSYYNITLLHTYEEEEDKKRVNDY